MVEEEKYAYCGAVVAVEPYVETLVEETIRSIQRRMLTLSKRRGVRDNMSYECHLLSSRKRLAKGHGHQPLGETADIPVGIRFISRQYFICCYWRSLQILVL